VPGAGGQAVEVVSILKAVFMIESVNGPARVMAISFVEALGRAPAKAGAAE